MKFLSKIEDLNNKYCIGSCGIKDRALLYDICDDTPPLAKHIVFLPMPERVMQELVKNYKKTFPRELLVLFKTMNGADLFWSVRRVGKKGIRISRSCFSIYGVPLTDDREHIEPYNISIEDLDRPYSIPESWLKFGHYYGPDNKYIRLDLYVDTDGTGVYAIEHENNECNIGKTWATIDTCLCDVFDLLEATHEECKTSKLGNG